MPLVESPMDPAAVCESLGLSVSSEESECVKQILCSSFLWGNLAQVEAEASLETSRQP